MIIVTILTSSLYYTKVNNSHTPLLSPLIYSDKYDKINYEGDLRILKDVGEAYLYHFGLDDYDFELISTAGFDIVEGNFDICANDDDVEYFLDQSRKYNLQVIMPAGSGEAEWGYSCDEKYETNQLPKWDKIAVTEWIDKWKDHDAIYAWDISNEAGSVFPNSHIANSKLRLDQIQTAYTDVKQADPYHPTMIRMNGWYFYDYDNEYFRPVNPFGENTADIVMINAYSNVESYFDDFVETVTQRAINSITKINPKTTIIVSLGVWEEPPLWFIPNEKQITSEKNTLSKLDIERVAYFKYGAKESGWYLPEDVPEIWSLLSKLNNS